MSEYNFQKFIKTGARLSNYTISLTGSYSFGFNSGFYNKEGIKGYKKVVLFHDSDKKAIGFHFTNDLNAEGAFTIIHSKTGATGSVTAKSFIVANKLDKKEYQGKKTPQKVNYDNILLFVVQLDKIL